MLTGEIRNQVDRVWDAFWSGGISNPLGVIEQLTYLLFFKRLDEIHIARENKANRLGVPIEDPIFGPDQQHLRWSRFKNFAPAEEYRVIASEVFPFAKTLGRDETAFAAHYPLRGLRRCICRYPGK
jgi:type I restriction enzyme M protein